MEVRALVGKFIRVALVALCLSGPGWAQDYCLYAVRSTDTLQQLAARQRSTVEAIYQLNPSLRQGPFPAPGTVIFLPEVPPEPAKAKPKVRPVRPAASDEVKSEAEPQIATRLDSKESSNSLSDTDIQAIYESVVEPVRGRGREMDLENAPSVDRHQNVVTTSDGGVLYVPTARRKVVHKPTPEPTESKHRTLTSRRGLRCKDILKDALRFMGVPYVWGGESPSGFDCSGFVQYVYAKNGISLPRTADLQFEVGKVVKRGEEQPGDLVFFETYCPGASHIGIYLGRHQFVHASSAAAQITISDLREAHFQRCYLGSKRVW